MIRRKKDEFGIAAMLRFDERKKESGLTRTLSGCSSLLAFPNFTSERLEEGSIMKGSTLLLLKSDIALEME